MEKQLKSKKRNKKEKTVYFLGAGFSKEAGVPSQSKLLKKVLDGLNADPDPNSEKLKKFAEEIFSLKESSIDKNYEFYPTIEDIFSVIDIALQNEEYVKDFRYADLSSLRKHFMLSIIKAIDVPYDHKKYDYIEKFAKDLTDMRLKSDQGKDLFSIISTNWDIVLINAFIKEFGKYHKKIEKKHPIKSREKLVEYTKKKNLHIPMIDYCIYTHSIEGEGSIHLSSIKVKPSGFYNVKYIALHGHANFVFCPRCSRLFSRPSFEPHPINFTKLVLNEPKCAYCNKGYTITNHEKAPDLEPVLIMPSYIRNFKNRHYYAIWQNAAIELQEATKIVFIGYSLPQSDFYIRHLLLTNLNKDAEIEIVTECDKKEKYEKCKNYVQLFGDRILEDNIHHEGACKYIRRLTKDSDIICRQTNR